MKFIIDTNVVFSGLHSPSGPPGRLLFLAAEGRVELLAPHAVRVELRRVLPAKVGYPKERVEFLLEALPIEWLDEEMYADAKPEAQRLVADASDAPMVAAALVLRFLLVTGDKQTRARAAVRVTALTPAEAVAMATRASET